MIPVLRPGRVGSLVQGPRPGEPATGLPDRARTSRPSALVKCEHQPTPPRQRTELSPGSGPVSSSAAYILGSHHPHRMMTTAAGDGTLTVSRNNGLTESGAAVQEDA